MDEYGFLSESSYNLGLNFNYRIKIPLIISEDFK